MPVSEASNSAIYTNELMLKDAGVLVNRTSSYRTRYSIARHMRTAVCASSVKPKGAYVLVLPAVRSLSALQNGRRARQMSP